MYDGKDVRKAYELAVGLVINYQYSISDKWNDEFERIAKMLNDNSIPLHAFMKAVFEYRWVVNGKRGYRHLKYPYPNQIAGPKALSIYSAYIAKYGGVLSNEEQLEQEITNSTLLVERLQLSMNELYDLYMEGRVSIYYLALRQDFYKWVLGKELYKKIDMEFVKKYKNSYLFLMSLDTTLFYRLASLVGR